MLITMMIEVECMKFANLRLDGCVKSFIVTSLGYQAYQMGLRVGYF
jgi:hypothetical protein